MSGRSQRENGIRVCMMLTVLCGSPISSRLKLYPQMATDPIQGHPSWALVLVAVSVGETAGKAGPVCGLGQPSNGNSRSPSCIFTEGDYRARKRRGWRFLSRLYTSLREA